MTPEERERLVRIDERVGAIQQTMATHDRWERERFQAQEDRIIEHAERINKLELWRARVLGALVVISGVVTWIAHAIW